MNIINRLPDDIVASIVERLAEAIFSDPNLTNRRAVQYGLLSKTFYCALKKRSVCNFDATPEMEKQHLKECLHLQHSKVFNSGGGDKLETFILTFELINHLYYHVLIDRATSWKRLKTLNLSNLDRGVSKTILLPDSVFRVPSLVHLGLMGWCLNPKRGIEWPNLKRLCLDSVTMDWIVFEDAMSSSPSLENLVIRDYKEPWKCPGYKLPGFQNLKTLHLDKCEGVDDDFFTGFAKRFPRLEDLCLQENPSSRVCVSSRSLRKIRLVNMLLLKEARFDVPSVVQFEFEGYYKTRLGKSNILPELSVMTARSEGWTAVIRLGSKSNLTRQLKQELEEFVTGLNGSKISVHLTS